MIVISVGGLAMVGLVNRLGVHTTAGYGVTLQMWAYVQMPALAIGAMAPDLLFPIPFFGERGHTHSIKGLFA